MAHGQAVCGSKSTHTHRPVPRSTCGHIDIVFKTDQCNILRAQEARRAADAATREAEIAKAEAQQQHALATKAKDEAERKAKEEEAQLKSQEEAKQKA